MEYFQLYEGGTTYLLEIDHDKKLFSVGSFQGKPKRGTRFVEIDQTAYAEHIRKIDRDYQCLDNRTIKHTNVGNKSLDSVIKSCKEVSKNGKTRVEKSSLDKER